MYERLKPAGAKRTSAASGGAGWFVACCRFGARPDQPPAARGLVNLVPPTSSPSDRTEEIRVGAGTVPEVKSVCA